MKKYIALATILAAFIAAPAVIRAQDAATNSAAATTPKKHAGGKAVQGKVSAVDATAMTIMVSEKTYTVTSDTKITKGKKPATLSDIAVGDMVSITSKKGEAGALNATAISVGGKKKKSDAGAPAAGAGN